MDSSDILTQVIFKKFSNTFTWLTFPDLRKIISKYDDIIPDEDFIDIHSVRIITDKVHHLLLKINDLKLQRDFSQTIQTDTFEEIIPNSETFIDKTAITPVMSYKTYSVFVDSKDRDKEKWENINPFQFTLGPSSIETQKINNNNSIFRNFSNVHAVTIKQVILPYTEKLFPYLLITINELGPNLNSTNNLSNNAFGYLSKPEIINNYAYYIFTESYDSLTQSGQNTHMTKLFSPRIEISRLTFSINEPNGDTLYFDNNEDESIAIELQITCLRKELDNSIIMRPT